MNRSMRNSVWMIPFLIVMPFAAVADRSIEPPVSLCKLAQWDASMAGHLVVIRADYSTDFMHGARLVSPDCPDFSLAMDVGEPSSRVERASVAAFDDMLARHRKFYLEGDFWVVVRGRFVWLPAKTINPDSAPRKQMTIPAHGALALRQVLDYQKPPAPTR